MKKLHSLVVSVALAIAVLFCGAPHAAAQTYCPQNLFGSQNAKPTAGQWWLCLNFLQIQAQGNQALSSLTGLLKGNGGSPVTAATAGTDYETPANVTTAITSAIPSATTSQLYGGTGAAGAETPITLGTGLSITAGVLNASGGGGGGALALISTQSGTGVSGFTWSGIASSVYDVELRCHSLTASTTTGLAIQVGTGAGPTWVTSSTYYQQGTSATGSTVSTGALTARTQWGATSSGSIGTASFINLDWTITNLQLGYGSSAFMLGSESVGAAAAAGIAGTESGNIAPGAAVTAIRLTPNSGTLTGSCSLYAYSGAS